MTRATAPVRDHRRYLLPMLRIGIVMLTAVGDAVHVLPVVTALRRHDPTAHITWILQPGPASLVRGHPSVDELVIFDRHRGLAAWSEVRRALAARAFDIVLDLQPYFKAGLLTAMTRSPVKLGFDRARARDLNWLFTTRRIPPHSPQHVQEQYFEFLTALGIPHEPVEWKLGPWEHERAWQSDFTAHFERPICTLVIGSSKPEKDWVPERWAAVADALYHDHGLQPVLVGARSAREAATEAAILAAARAPVATALDSGLRRLVGILDASALVISLDTGPLHMSVALGRPVISLVGYTDPGRTGPFRRFHDLVVDAFHDSPGDPGPISTATRTGRMARITVEDVLERVERWKRTYRGAVVRP